MSDDESKIVIRKGSKQRLLPFAAKIEQHSEPEDLRVQLMLQGVEGPPEQVAEWAIEFVRRSPADWSDDVLDVVRDRTDARNARCDFVVQAVENDGTVYRSYAMQAQPSTENLSASPEGLVLMSMRHSTAAIQAMLADRTAATQGYRDTIKHLTDEIERLNRTIVAYQRREDESRTRELALMDRERSIIMREANSIQHDAERSGERLDRIVEKLGEAAETMGAEMVRAGVQRMAPNDVATLLKELGPIAAKLMGGN